MADMNKKNYAVIAIALLILAWWFKYDTHCGGNASVSCVAYDRFTGQWILPVQKVKED